jgi:hypothetical protein
MTRVISAAAATAIAATIVLLTIYGVAHLFPTVILMHRIPRWFGPTCGLFSVFCGVVVALKQRRAKLAEEEPLTPIMPRIPTTGMREI